MSITQGTPPHVFDLVPLDPIYLEGGIEPRCRVCGGAQDDAVHMNNFASVLARIMVVAGAQAINNGLLEGNDDADHWRDESRIVSKSTVDLIVARLKDLRDRKADCEGDDQYVAFFQYWDELIDDLTEASRELES